MGLPKIHSLTDTDIKILLSLVKRQTLEEVALSSGVPFSYCQTRLRYLKKKRYIDSVDKSGQAFIYQTCRLPETEPLFTIVDNTNSQTKNVYRIPYFYGKTLTFGEAFSWVNEQNSANNTKQSLLQVIKWSLAVIKNRSHRKFIGEQFSQHPDEERMREELGKYIAMTERELKLAKELYDTKFLWSGHENIWSIISEGEPTETVLKAYKEAGAFVK
jgi:hypothetical protein